jgi:hypothetical protein
MQSWRHSSTTEIEGLAVLTLNIHQEMLSFGAQGAFGASFWIINLKTEHHSESL